MYAEQKKSKKNGTKTVSTKETMGILLIITKIAKSLELCQMYKLFIISTSTHI